mmetsp:Transcript_11682/g.25596  ORF Transcript_11682/g.25596 Transcript_11682/m.25596 type:complete len:1292 (-) Transcript_11682:60-3935(-)
MSSLLPAEYDEASLVITPRTDDITTKAEAQNGVHQNQQLITASHLPSHYGSCPLPPSTLSTEQQQQQRVLSSPSSSHSLLSNLLLMGSSTTTLNSFASSPSLSPTTDIAAAALNNTGSATVANITISDQEESTNDDDDNSILAVENNFAAQEDKNETQDDDDATDEAITNSTLKQEIGNRMNSILTPIINRLLAQTAAADKLHQYTLPTLLLQNAKYATLAFLAIYLLVLLLLWIPLYLLSQLLSEPGVYLFVLASLAYGGKCLLRLLAFPGTNVKVYGEIENEFGKYSCGMLESGAGAIDDFAKSLRSGAGTGGAGSVSVSSSSKSQKVLGIMDNNNENDGWDIVDVSATYKRVKVYKQRVFGVYLEVLHCLLEEHGQGCSTSGANDVGIDQNNGFYRLGESMSACKDTCKRNLCCDKRNTSNDHGESFSSHHQSNNSEGEGIQLESNPHHSPSNSSSFDNHHEGCSTTTTTQYGNNLLMGDVGNMGNLTTQAKSDGRELYTLLSSLLKDLATLESSSSNILRNMEDRVFLKNAVVSKEMAEHATKLIARAGELRELMSRIKLSSSSGDTTTDNEDEQPHQNDDEDSEEMGAEAIRNRLEEQSGTASSVSNSSTMGMVWSGVQAFVSMVDPPPHNCIFGLDVIRGCFLARYHGAKQFWVKRSSNGGVLCRGDDGKLDVILIPSSTTATSSSHEEKKDSSIESFLPLSPRKGRGEDVVKNAIATGGTNNNVGGERKKAVLYCNPNAGLVEVSTGMGLTGGNVNKDKDEDEKEPTCWTEYYIEHGYDVYLFNYAGYGRSFGGSSWNDTTSTEFSHGFLGALKRVLFSTFLAFKPSSESLKSDAAAVARHLVDVVGVDELIIHGESIGGMAAAGAARSLTENNTAKSSQTSTLLICDRTFCNLEAVAQRLVGQWTGNAIRLLTPSWSTDVARDFLAARCPKIVANDCSDEIIHDYSSLKSGLSFAGEFTKGQTNNLGWVMSPPTEYRIADLDNVTIENSRLATSNAYQIKNPPTWPADKHMSLSEAHHFAACVRRIGKLATVAKKQMQARLGDSGLSNNAEADEGIEVSLSSSDEPSSQLLLANNKGNSVQKMSDAKALINLWNNLQSCNGLCGHHLGYAVKEGFDCTIAWLCCTVIFGSQVLAEKAEKRWDKSPNASTAGLNDDSRGFLQEDFDLRPQGCYQWDEDDLAKHPLPIPEVLSSLKDLTTQKNALKEVEAELNYVIGMLEYIVSRSTSKESTALSLRRRNGCDDEQGVISTGCFLNLHCGHNNQYSSEEREKLIALIRRSCGDSV